jgi:EAL domain-containing protein (putative c-di-GMP-specific phosphodiesterase class I)
MPYALGSLHLQAAADLPMGLQPNRFTCEITESVAMEDTQVTRSAFDRLGKLGVHVSPARPARLA